MDGAIYSRVVSDVTDAMEDYRKELERLRRIADQLCTAHSIERERFHWRAKVLDIVMMLGSLYLVSMAFVDPVINNALTPLGLNPVIWIGTVAIIVFGFSIIQLTVDWKGRADAHGRSLSMYAEAKSNCIEALNGTAQVSKEVYSGISARYNMASDIGIHIQDSRFLKLKQRHLVKIELSKQLDSNPSLCFPLAKIKLWWRDNIKS